jgi:parallel beta-helix repeat protein
LDYIGLKARIIKSYLEIMWEEHMKKSVIFCLLIIGLMNIGMGLSLCQKNITIDEPILNEMRFELKYEQKLWTGADLDIQSDQDLIDYGFPGDGSSNNPYRIENYTIDTENNSAIYIKNTTKHIVIQNCTLKGYDETIIVTEVADGTVKIDNNTIDVTYSMGQGIATSYSPGLMVSNNHIFSCYWGINYNSCPDVKIDNNTFENTHYGVRVEWNSTDTIITNNEFYNNQDGVALLNAPRARIVGNVFKDHWVGILLSSSTPEFSSSGCEISYNLIEDSESYGILITAFAEQSFSGQNVIHHNTFINNNPGGTSQAKDIGSGNVWYDKESRKGNFWSEWRGVIDYKIDGSAKSKDKYPLSAPVHEVTVDLPIFLRNRVILFTTIIPVSVAVLAITSYLIIKRRKK